MWCCQKHYEVFAGGKYCDRILYGISWCLWGWAALCVMVDCDNVDMFHKIGQMFKFRSYLKRIYLYLTSNTLLTQQTINKPSKITFSSKWNVLVAPSIDELWGAPNVNQPHQGSSAPFLQWTSLARSLNIISANNQCHFYNRPIACYEIMVALFSILLCNYGKWIEMG